ncbi:DUF6318 family protein [Georgenia sp. H159]|uniref:DUF6318 family protein n=1 Tax=Georgenia sp. H159 TaxID=3076115 RepID=UPI002D78148C|nr:DUF6318 family protein [Georgenia sp. H159]
MTEAPSPTPGPTPWPEPTRPAAMERDDVEGAKAAAEYFLKLFSYVYATGDLSEWSEFTHSDCMFCTSVAEDVSELYAHGGYADGPAIEVLTMEAMPPDEDYAYYSVAIEASERTSRRFDRAGVVTEENETSDLEVDLVLDRVDGEWTIRGAVGTTPMGSDSDGRK